LHCGQLEKQRRTNQTLILRLYSLDPSPSYNEQKGHIVRYLESLIDACRSCMEMKETEDSKRAPALLCRTMAFYITILFIPMVIFWAYIDKSRFVVTSDYYILTAVTAAIIGFSFSAATIDGRFHPGMYELIRNRVGLVRILTWAAVNCLLIVSVTTNRHALQFADWLAMVGILFAAILTFVADMATFICYASFRHNSTTGTCLPPFLMHTAWNTGRVAVLAHVSSAVLAIGTWILAMAYPTVHPFGMPDKALVDFAKATTAFAILGVIAQSINQALSMASLYSDEEDNTRNLDSLVNGSPNEQVEYKRVKAIPWVQNKCYTYTWYEITQNGILFLQLLFTVSVACIDIKHRRHAGNIDD
jgi:hypothetical protein